MLSTVKFRCIERVRELVTSRGGQIPTKELQRILRAEGFSRSSIIRSVASLNYLIDSQPTWPRISIVRNPMLNEETTRNN